MSRLREVNIDTESIQQCSKTVLIVKNYCTIAMLCDMVENDEATWRLLTIVAHHRDTHFDGSEWDKYTKLVSNIQT